MTAPTTTSPSLSLRARDVFTLTKPRLSGQVIFTCGVGILLAPGRVGTARALIGLLATSMVVGAANALNNYLERDLDRYMDRTRDRALPAGRLDPRVALGLAFGLAAVAVPALTLAFNPLTALLAVAALAAYVLVYTPMKQRSALALWAGAVPGAIPVLMGWTAVRNRIEVPGLVLFAIMFCWQIPHFIAIAIYRQDDYARAGHKILPLVAPDRVVKRHAAAWAALLVASSLALVPLGIGGRVYGAVAAVLGAGFLGWTLVGLGRPEGDRRWARGLFLGSLTYLTLLFITLAASAG